MPTQIENSVVSMSFDNSKFEKNAHTTMSTLDKLRKALDFSGQADSLNRVSEAAGRVDMTPLQNGVQEVHNKFSILEVAAITALANITNRAVDAGVRIGKALTIDSIIGGFGEYELMMNSIQTIMSGTGASLDVVNSKLNELNEYADRTIYVFSDMTKNIGKFTNAGVDLDTAVAAMKGISNEAALSGANAEEASRAMYNIAQALSTGYMQYIDWKSIENANMATIDFKENLVETALDIGTLSEATVKAAPSINALFKESLKDSWLSNDVLLTTLSKYADETTDLGKRAYAAAQDIKTFHQMWDTLIEAAGSGWSQTFQYIVGDFDQAKSLWTRVGNYFGDMIQRSSDARNQIFKTWNQSGGRAYVIDGLSEAFHALLKVAGNVKLAFGDIFQGLDNSQIFDLSANFYYFAKNLNDTLAPVAKDIRHTFDGLFAVLHMGVNVITSLGRAFGYLIGNSGIGGLSSGILGFTGNIGEYLKALDETITKNDTFFKILKKVADTLLLIPKGMNAVFQSLTGMGFTEALGRINGGLQTFYDFLKEIGGMMGDNLRAKIESLKETFSGLGTECGILEIIFKGVADGLSAVAGVIFDIVSAIGKAMTETFGQADVSNVMDFINTAGLAGGLSGFLLQLKNLIDPLDDIGGAINNLREDLQIMGNAIKAETIWKIAESVALLAVSCMLLASVDSDALGQPMIVITTFVGEMMAAFAIMDKITNPGSATGWFAGIQNFGTSINNLMNSVSAGIKARILVKLAESVLILAVSLKIISSIEPGRLIGSMTALTVLLGEMVVAALALNKWGGKIKTGGFIAMASGLMIISGALKVISTIEPYELVGSVIALTVVLGALTAALTGLSFMNGPAMLAGAAGMLVVSNALLITTASLKILATMELEEIGRGLLAMFGGLAIIVAALTGLSFMSPIGLVTGAAALITASAAIMVIAGALKLLSTMNGDGLNTSLTALVVSLGALAAALLLMRTAIPGATALIIAAGAIAILAPSLALLSAIPFTAMMTGIGGLAILLGVLAGAAILLGPVLPMMAALTGTLLLFGAACLAVGAGMALLATGLATLAVSGVAGATALVGILSVILGAIPMVVNAVVLFVETVIKAFIELVPLFIEAVTVIITAVCQAIITRIPMIVETALTLIVALLTSLRDHLPEIFEIGVDIIIELMTGIEERLPEFIDKAFDVVIAFIDGLGQAIEDHADDLREVMIKFGEHLWNAFCEFFGIHSPSTKFQEGGVFMIEGLINGIDSMIESVKAKLGELKDRVLEKLGEKASDFITRGKEWMTKLRTGVETMKSSLVSKAGSIASSMHSKMSEKKEQFKSIGINFMAGLRDGLESMRNTVVSKAADIGSTILSKLRSIFDIHSPSREAFAITQFVDLGMIEGFDSLKKKVVDSAARVASGALTAINNGFADVTEDISDLFDFDPSIRPVVDLSGIQNGVKKINDIFKNDAAFDQALELDYKRTHGDSSSSGSVYNSTTIINNNVDIQQKNEMPNHVDDYTIYKNNRKLKDMMEGVALV